MSLQVYTFVLKHYIATLPTLTSLQIYKLYKLTNLQTYKLTNVTNLQNLVMFTNLQTYKLTNFPFSYFTNFIITNLQTYKVGRDALGLHSVESPRDL